jgi:hypothetical protein
LASIEKVFFVWHNHAVVKKYDLCAILMMKKGQVRYLVLMMMALNSMSAIAQSVANYAVTRTSGNTYASIATTGSSFAGWRYSGAFSEDDNRSIATDIGFDFWYNGSRYTQFSVSTNGFMDFSSSTDDGGPDCDDYGYCNFQFSASNVDDGTWLALAPFYDDMTTAGGSDPLGTSIKYQLSGTAPNRVLTVEWIGMAVYQNTSPNVNFQVKIYETTGVIEYWYGIMNNGTNTFSYTVGINAETISGAPTAAELLTQQTANSTNFSNAPQNNLSTMPAANSKLIFTPVTPANPAGNLTFTGISNTEMTLNWSDWANNEVGYVLYYSIDNVNFFYQNQVAANSTSTVVSGLLPSTTYYWQVYAVTEGTLSQPLIGNAITLAPGTVTSVANGRWDRTATWDCGCIPSLADNVIVNNNVRIRSVADANDLTINNGGIVRFVRNTDRTLTINGDLLVNVGAQFYVDANSSALHTVNINGNITNNGSVNLLAGANNLADVYFTGKLGNQSISGSGATNAYNSLFLDKGFKSNTLEILSPAFSCNAEALNFISGGTFKFSSSGAINLTLFSTTRSIPGNGKVEMNSANSIMSFGGGIDLQGDLVLSTGTVNIGDAADENLTVNGGAIQINGGALNIAGRLDRSTTESAISYLQTAGVLTLPTVGSTSATLAPFMMDVTGSTFDVSGGTIIIEREGGGGTQDFGIITTGASLGNVTGGTLQIGNASAPASQIMGLELGTAIGSLVLNSANVTGQIVGSDINVLNNVELLAGTLVDNGNNITVAGDWLNSAGSFSGSSLVSLTGGNQSITSGTSVFNDLTLAGSGTKSIQDNLTALGDLTISSTLGLSTGGLQIAVGGNWINNGNFSRNNETLLLNGGGAQSVTGTTNNEFTNITVSKSGGAVSIDSDLNLYSTLSITSATNVDLDGTGSTVFRLVSSATDDARIAALDAGASLSGNMLFEKYFAGAGFKYWRHIGAPVTGATVADLQNEIPISGTFTGNDNGTGVIPINAFPSLYYYDAGAGLSGETLDDRWVVYPPSSDTEILNGAGTEARGYAIWVRETTPFAWNLTGPSNYGTIDLNISGANEGWNLMANPYPSDIDWDNAGWTKTNIQGNAIFVWDGVQYLTWNGTIGSLNNGLIAKGQGFWVQASSATPQLIATETVKTANNATTYRIAEEETHEQVIELTLATWAYKDKSYIQFSHYAQEGFDQYDAGKLTNSIFNLSTLSSDSIPLSINVRNLEMCETLIPIKIENAWNGEYTLRISYPSQIETAFVLSLHDGFTDVDYNLASINGLYNFTVNDENGAQEADRFWLKMTPRSLNQSLEVKINQDCNDASALHINLPTSQLNAMYEVYVNDVLDTILHGSGGQLDYQINNYLEIGPNNIDIQALTHGCLNESVRFHNSFDLIFKPVITLNESTNELKSVNGQAGLWYYNNELVSSEPTSTYSANDLSGGVYYLEVANDNCLLKSNEFLVTSLENDLNIELKVSPVPADRNITVNFSGRVERIIVSDVSGRIYYMAKQSVKEIDISSFENGLYFLTVDTGEEKYTVRFIKQ